MFKTGWRADTPLLNAQVEAFSSRRLGAGDTERALPRSTSNLAHLCTVRDQVDTSACVLFAFCGAIKTRLRRLGFHPPDFAPQPSYQVARMLARLDKTVPLDDDGSYPALAARGIKTYGLPLESSCPFNPATINEEPDFQTFVEASSFRLQAFTKIYETGEARVAKVMECLADSEPVPLGMQVGDEFQNYTSSRNPVGVEVGNTGGHMVYLVDYEDDGDVFIGCNSWGTQWGDHGFFRMTRQKLMHSSTSDLYNMVIIEES